MVNRDNPEFTDAIRNETVNKNYGLVVKTVNSFIAIRPELKTYRDDLFQEGVIGLMKGTERFDPELGFAFSTYVMWWIKQSIGRFIINNLTMIRIPVHAWQKFMKADVDFEALDEFDKKTYIATKSANTWSLDTALSNGGDDRSDGVAMDTVADDTILNDEQIEDECIIDIKKVLEDIIASARKGSKTERSVIWLIEYFGFNASKEHRTLESIARDYNCTRELVRQQIGKALNKMRLYMARDNTLSPETREKLKQMYNKHLNKSLGQLTDFEG